MFTIPLMLQKKYFNVLDKLNVFGTTLYNERLNN